MVSNNSSDGTNSGGRTLLSTKRMRPTKGRKGGRVESDKRRRQGGMANNTPPLPTTGAVQNDGEEDIDRGGNRAPAADLSPNTGDRTGRPTQPSGNVQPLASVAGKGMMEQTTPQSGKDATVAVVTGQKTGQAGGKDELPESACFLKKLQEDYQERMAGGGNFFLTPKLLKQRAAEVARDDAFSYIKRAPVEDKMTSGTFGTLHNFMMELTQVEGQHYKKWFEKKENQVEYWRIVEKTVRRALNNKRTSVVAAIRKRFMCKYRSGMENRR